MADTRISALADGSTIQSTDMVPVVRSGVNTRVVVTKAALSLGNVTNTSDANKPVSTAQQTALDLKANLASPTLTGTPVAPTAAAATNTTQIATTAHVFAERANAATLTNKTLTSPVLTTPALGTPASGALTNCTAVPAGQIVGVIPIANLATGTPTGAKFVRDDGTLAVPAGGGGGGSVAWGDITGTLSDQGDLNTSLSAKVPKSTLVTLATFVFDGAGSAPAAATSTTPVTIPAAATITGYTVEGDVSGSIVVDIKKVTGAGSYASIVASAPPTLSSALFIDSTTLTGWTTAIAAKDRLKGIITSASTLTKGVVKLYGTIS